MRKLDLQRLVLLLTAAIFVAAPAWANLVENPSFSTGDFTDWTVNTSSSFPWAVDSGTGAFTGTFFASTGCVGAQCITGIDPVTGVFTPSDQASLAQTLTTTPGATYDLSFEFNTQGNGTPNELDVLWNGTTALDLGPGGTLGIVSSYTDYIVTGLVATSSSTTLEFLGRQDPGFDSLGFVDVEQVGASSVPEPSYLLLGAAVFAFAGLRRLGKRVLASR